MNFVQLWAEDTPKDFFPSLYKGREGVGLLKLRKSFTKDRPICLIIPGSAYMAVAVTIEGLETAAAMEEAGYAAAILNYRVSPEHYPCVQKDMALAMKYLCSLAGEEGLQNQILTLGYSAGGHLNAIVNGYPQEYDTMLMEKLKAEFPVLYKKYQGLPVKADQVCLSYTVTDLMEDQVCFENLTGGDESLRDKVSIVRHITSDYPRTFLWACRDDATVPYENSVRMHAALESAGVKSMCRIYPAGDHGIALESGTSAEGWLKEMLAFMR